MDIIRAGYSISMRQYPGGPAIPGRWVRARPGAKFIDVPTPFHSRWHDGPDYQAPIGEVWPDPFYPRCGQIVTVNNPATSCLPGLNRCGSDAVWRGEGDPARDPFFTPLADGAPACCERNAWCIVGGEAEGGSAELMAVNCFPLGCRDYPRGGEREGGSAELVLAYGADALGGERQGGAAEFLELGRADALGGEREGGVAELVGPYVDGFGGEEEGGSAELIPASPAPWDDDFSVPNPQALVFSGPTSTPQSRSDSVTLAGVSWTRTVTWSRAAGGFGFGDAGLVGADSPDSVIGASNPGNTNMTHIDWVIGSGTSDLTALGTQFLALFNFVSMGGMSTSVRMIVHSPGGNSSDLALSISPAGVPQTIAFTFSSFSTLTGSGVDFTAVEEVELILNEDPAVGLEPGPQPGFNYILEDLAVT
jgi:hypothetical protein